MDVVRVNDSVITWVVAGGAKYATQRNENQSINQSKFIFQAIRNNYNIINVTALERLPEKHYAH